MPVLGDKMARAKAAQAKYEGQLLTKENVVGVSIGQDEHGEIAIVVLVDNDAPQSVSDQIPHELDGVPVVVRQVGKLEALYQAKRDITSAF
jgi:hypothetical protein